MFCCESFGKFESDKGLIVERQMVLYEKENRQDNEPSIVFEMNGYDCCARKSRIKCMSIRLFGRHIVRRNGY